ncbi:hypothetical protein GCM10027180_21570 [Microbulbifer echini]
MGYFRHPKTKNEMKQYYASLENELEIPIKIRNRRRPKCLPNAWDDYFPSNITNRNWKLFRRKQWKG